MKTPPCFRLAFIGTISLLALLPAADAATYYWTPSSAASGRWENGQAGVAAGNGWSSTSGGTGNSVWVNGSSATFERNASMQLGNSSAGLTVSVGSLTINSGSTLTLNTPVQVAVNQTKILAISGASSGNLSVAGTSFADSTARLRVELSAAFNGQITLTGGNNNGLALMSTSAGGSNLAVELDGGGVLVLGDAIVGTSVTIGELSGTGGLVAATFNNVGGTRTLNVNQANDTTFGGVLAVGSNAGAGMRVLALTKSGNGTLGLTGTNTFAGATIVNGGTLLISGGGSINGTTGVSVDGASAILRYDSSVALTQTVTYGASGGTFLYNSAAKYTGGSGSLTAGTDDVVGGDGVLGNVTIATGGTLTPGELGAGSAGMLTVDSLTLQAGATSNFDVLSDVAFDSINSVGVIQLAGAFNLTFSSILASGSDLVLFDGASIANNFASISALGAYSGSFAIEDGTYRLQQGNQMLSFDHLTGVLSVHAIPEPSTTLLLTGGLMAVLIFRRRSRI